MKNGLGNVGFLAMDLLYDLMGGTYDDAIHSIAQGLYAVRELVRLLSTRIRRALQGLGGRHSSSPSSLDRHTTVEDKNASSVDESRKESNEARGL